MSLLQMSFSGAMIIAAVVVIRALALHRLPKNAFLVLWAIALVRLLIPYSLPSAFSVYSLAERFSSARSAEMAETAQAAESAEMAEAAQAAEAAEMAEAAELVEAAQATESAEAAQAAESAEMAETYDAGSRIAANDAAITVITGAGQEADSLALGGSLARFHENLGSGNKGFYSVWLAGVLCGATFFTTAYIRCRLRFRESMPVGGDYAEQWLREHKLCRSISIRSSDRISAPLTYGVLRPVILVPKNCRPEDAESMKYVLAHEYVHIRRFDAAAKLALTAALCVHWFNPTVWLMYFLANRDIELSCDEAVVRMFGEQAKKEYAMALVRMEEARSVFVPLCNYFNKNATEERIGAIMKIKKRSWVAVGAAVILTVGVAVLFATSAQANTNRAEIAYSETEWWTEEEFAAWVGKQKVELPAMIGATTWTPSTGWVTWTQEMVDDSIGEYEKTLEDIRNGMKLSKTVAESEGDRLLGVQYAMLPGSENVSVESGTAVAGFDDGSGNVVTGFDSGNGTAAAGFENGNGTAVAGFDNGTAAADFANGREVTSASGDIFGSVAGDEVDSAKWIAESEWFPDYAKYGLAYDAERSVLTYGGKVVVFFHDEFARGEYIHVMFGVTFGQGTVALEVQRDADFNVTGLKVRAYPVGGTAVQSEKEQDTKRQEECIDDYISDYGQFGISFDKDGKMLYYGEPVRFFVDGAEIDGDGGLVTQHAYYNDAGTVTIRTVRQPVANADGSYDPFGPVTAIRKMDEDWENLMDFLLQENPAQEAVAEGDSTPGGIGFAEQFAKYKDFGIKYAEAGSGSGNGNVYYNGRLVGTFSDVTPEGGAFSFQSAQKGGIDVRTVYDESGKLLGIDEK